MQPISKFKRNLWTPHLPVPDNEYIHTFIHLQWIHSLCAHGPLKLAGMGVCMRHCLSDCGYRKTFTPFLTPSNRFCIVKYFSICINLFTIASNGCDIYLHLRCVFLRGNGRTRAATMLIIYDYLYRELFALFIFGHGDAFERKRVGTVVRIHLFVVKRPAAKFKVSIQEKNRERENYAWRQSTSFIKNGEFHKYW